MDKQNVSRDHVPSLGPRVRERRAAVDMSIREAGENSGVAFADLHRVEVGKRSVALASAAKLAPVLRCSIDYLAALTDDPRPVNEILAELASVKRQLAAATRGGKTKRAAARPRVRK
jgi:transcriptional regulator with XRE-family HTH domain